MKNFAILSVFFLGFVLAIPAVSAQESEERVIDEVVAQVNEGVITLSRVKREIKTIVDSEVQQGKKREEVQKLIDAEIDRNARLIGDLLAA